MENKVQATSIKVDPDVLAVSKELFQSLGLSFSGAINLFLRQAIRERAIPFRIALEEDELLYNAETLRVIQDARKGIGLSGPYHSVEELMDSLNGDDEEEAE